MSECVLNESLPLLIADGTALHRASEFGDAEIIIKLLDAGADPTLKVENDCVTLCDIV